MAKKRSPQARYQAALREIKRRTKATHKVAQAAYRLQRARVGDRAKYPTFYNALRASEIQATVANAFGTIQQSWVPREDFAFDIRDKFGPDVNARLDKLRSAGHMHIAQLVVKVEMFRYAKPSGTYEITRERVSTFIDDFWRAYHSACREAIKMDAMENDLGDDSAGVPTSVVLTQLPTIP